MSLTHARQAAKAVTLASAALATLLMVCMVAVGYYIFHAFYEQSICNLPNENDTKVLNVMTVEDSIDAVGIGQAQYSLLILCGLTLCADAAEVSFLSFVTEVLRCTWHLTPAQETAIMSSVFVGMIVGAPFWGWFADIWGRRSAFLWCSCFISFFGFASAACPSYDWFLTAQFLVGFGIGGIPIVFDIFAESLPTSDRGKILLVLEVFWTIGSVYVTFCAYLTLETGPWGWRLLTALAALPTLVSCVAVFIQLPESPIWLVDQGREKEAVAIVNNWAEVNGRHVRFEGFRHSLDMSETSAWDGFYNMKAALMCWIWLCFGILYLGLLLLLPHILEEKAKQNDSCNVRFDFISLGFSCACEVFGIAAAMAIIDTVGRGWSQAIFFGVGGVGTFMLGWGGKNIIMFAAGLARMGQMAAVSVTWIHTPELLPTNVRARIHTLLNLVARVGASAFPLFMDFFDVPTLTFMMMIASFLAAGAAMSLPETAGKLMGNIGEPPPIIGK